MIRIKLADRAAWCFALAILAGVCAVHFRIWFALAPCWLLCRWGVARVIRAANADA